MRSKVLENSVNKTIQFSTVFLSSGSSLYADFSNKERTTNDSFFFDLNDMKKILKLSVSLKIYSIFLYAEKGINIDNTRKVYDKFLTLLKANDLPKKIMEFLRIIAIKTNMRLIKYGIKNYKEEDESIDVCVFEAFKFVFNYGLIIHDYKRNPIPFFGKIIEKEVEYSKCKKQKIYIDDIEKLDGKIDGTIYKKKPEESVFVEDLILKKLYNTSKYFLSRMHQNNGENKKPKTGPIGHIDKIENISPIWEFILAPILEKAISINCKPLLKVRPIHVACISFYLGHQLNTIFLNQYTNFFNISFLFPTKPATKRFYRLKNVSFFINSTHHIPIYDSFIFNGSRINIVRILESFFGRILSTEFKSTFNGRSEKIDINDEFEKETINLVLKFLKGNVQNELDKLRKILGEDLQIYGQSLN
jgi:hypothetical protein